MAGCEELIHDPECSVVKQRVAVATATKTGRCVDANQDPKTEKSPKVGGRAWGGPSGVSPDAIGTWKHISIAACGGSIRQSPAIPAPLVLLRVRDYHKPS